MAGDLLSLEKSAHGGGVRKAAHFIVAMPAVGGNRRAFRAGARAGFWPCDPVWQKHQRGENRRGLGRGWHGRKINWHGDDDRAGEKLKMKYCALAARQNGR